MASRKIEVEILGDASSLERAFGRGSKSASQFQRGLSTASKVAGVALGALGLGAKVAFDELSESEKVSAQTNQVLKTTGGVANVTAKHVDDLADAILRKSGIDDEATRSSENLLLGFTKIRNEVGAGNQVFDRATQAVADFSVRTGRDASSAAVLLGKALEDPIGKVSSLARAGIVFTQQQKDQIKTLVESGNTLEAQKLILSGLEERYGGAAEAAGKTFAGQMAIAKEEAKNFGAELVQGSIPALTGLGRVLQTATEFMSKHQTATKVLIGVIAALSIGVLAVSAAMKVAAAAQAVMTAAQWALNVALDANPIGIVILALAALAAGIVIAWKRSETFRVNVTAAFTAAKIIVGTVVGAILISIDSFLAGLQAIATAASHLPFVGDKFRGVANEVAAARATVQNLQGAIDGLHSKTIEVTTIFHQVSDFTPGAKGGGGGGNLPGRAAGGAVAAGVAYTIGERGRETFVPASNGVIIPNGRGGGVMVHVHVAGSVVTENDLVDAVQKGLLRKQARTGTLGFA